MAEDINDYFKTFEEYSGVVKEALKSILHDSKMGTEDKIDVIYATGPLAFSKYLHKVTNGLTSGSSILSSASTFDCISFIVYILFFNYLFYPRPSSNSMC
jgi:hypothetical protein